MATPDRFIKTSSIAGAAYIKDTKDGSLVAIVMKGKREPEKTEAMIRVMLNALNGAVKGKTDEK